MSLRDFPLRYVARVTVEFTTPFHVGAGREGETTDAEIVRDVNDLPTIPGSSLAGVLKSEFVARGYKEAAKSIFGFQEPTKLDGNAGAQGSRLSVSWACIHDAKNIPVEGIIDPKRLGDKVLTCALLPTLRDHVRLNHRGASDAEGSGKFDELAVCRGHRFTFEMELVGSTADEHNWDQLLGILADPATRLGGKSRRGFGAFKVHPVLSAIFNLNASDDFKNYAERPAGFRETWPSLKPQSLGSPSNLSTTSASKTVVATLDLQPCGYWMFGGGIDDTGEADMAPLRDRIISWDKQDKGTVKDVLVIPGSAVKGAIAHRVAFHYNALKGTFADGKSPSELEMLVGYKKNKAVRKLFGYAKQRDSTDSDGQGQRGRVIIDDLIVDVDEDKPVPQQLVHHVSIDRFTGGARSGALFSERPLWRGWDWKFELAVRDSEQIKNKYVKKALDLTLRDLAESRLQVGAGSGRGLGFFKATEGVEWSDDGAWAEGEQ